MVMKRLIIGALILLAVMEFFSWQLYKSSKESDPEQPVSEEKTSLASKNVDAEKIDAIETEDTKNGDAEIGESQLNSADFENFPPPSVEEVNGKMERTIHVGVRQYVWEPKVIKAKKGELVRLLIHNADVKHGLVIPDLGVYQEIPEDGAVVEFIPDKAGSFEFFCSVWCGEGHMEMRGKIIIE